MKKIKIHPIFYLSIILLITLGLWRELLLVLFALSIHEIGHLFFINLLEYELYSLNIMVFGGVLSYQNKNDFLYKGMLISLGGVIFNFFFYILYFLLGLKGLANINLLFVLINIFPIFPLDGGKVLNIILAYFLPFKISKLITHIISIIATIFIFIFYIKSYYVLLMAIYLLKENIKALSRLNKNHNDMLLNKYLNPNEKLKRKKIKSFTINPIDNIFTGKNLIFDYETFSVTEEEVLEKHYKKRLAQ